ncbi:aldo/keto reductase [Neorhizobium sp. DT-125]|uniref:aldo/keto reductase n=1 Tax=Neorhizobium sp. DT-125 TaxID=3396163 RepID=UPI003F1B4F8E
MSDRNKRASIASNPTGMLASREISRIGYGAMQLRDLTNDSDRAVSLLRLAVDLGVDHIDTARFYGNGFVNEAIRRAVQPDAKVLVATKIGADPSPDTKPIPIRLAQRPEQLRASVDAELASLGVEQLSVVYLRRAKNGHGLSVEGDQIVDFDDQIAAMTEMRNVGKIGAIGLSGVDLVELRRAAPAGIACVQNAYSLVSRQDEELLSFCADQGIAWIPFFPLGGARPGLPKVTEQPVVIKVAAELGVTPSQVGLAWLVARAANIFLIPGTANPDHLRENLGSVSISLSAEMMAEFDRIAV